MKLYLYNKSNLNSNLSLLFYLNKIVFFPRTLPYASHLCFPIPNPRLTYTSHLCFPIWLWRPLLYFPIWLCKSLLYSFELRMRIKRRRLMLKHNTVPKIVFYNHWSLYIPFYFFNMAFLILLLYKYITINDCVLQPLIFVQLFLFF